MKYFDKVKSLFIDYNEELNRFVTQKLNDPSDAEEIVQETFHNFMRMEDSSEVENPRAYLYKTASNLALNRLRKDKYHRSFLEKKLEEQETPSLERVVFAQKDIDVFYRHIQELPSKTQAVFLKSRVDGKTYPEISKELHMSLSSVQKHMIRALQFLDKYLDEED